MVDGKPFRTLYSVLQEVSAAPAIEPVVGTSTQETSYVDQNTGVCMLRDVDDHNGDVLAEEATHLHRLHEKGPTLDLVAQEFLARIGVSVARDISKRQKLTRYFPAEEKHVTETDFYAALAELRPVLASSRAEIARYGEFVAGEQEYLNASFMLLSDINRAFSGFSQDKNYDRLAYKVDAAETFFENQLDSVVSEPFANDFAFFESYIGKFVDLLDADAPYAAMSVELTDARLAQLSCQLSHVRTIKTHAHLKHLRFALVLNFVSHYVGYFAAEKHMSKVADVRKEFRALMHTSDNALEQQYIGPEIEAMKRALLEVI